MKFSNRTHWRTDDLAAIVKRVAQDELEPAHRKRLTVYISYNRGKDRHRYTSGWAAVPGNWIRLMVPSGAVDAVDFACTAAHEMAHARGLHHREMRGSPRYYRQMRAAFYAWAAEFPIRRKQGKSRPSVEAKREQAHTHALKMVKQWTTKTKRAQTTLKKWQRRARAIERRMDVAAANLSGARIELT